MVFKTVLKIIKHRFLVKEDANHKNMEIGKKYRSFLLALKKIPHENLAIFKVKNPFKIKNLQVEFWSFWAETICKKKTCGPEGFTKVLK